MVICVDEFGPLRSELDEIFGLSAIVGITMGMLLFGFGLWRRPARLRR